MNAPRRADMTKHRFTNFLRAPTIILMMRTACSFVVGGWISKELFFAAQEESVDVPSKTIKRMLSLIFMSLIILVARLLIPLISYNSDSSPFSDWLIGFGVFLIIVMYWVACFYKSFMFAFRGEFFAASQWLLPLTFIIFIFVMIRPGYYQYVLDNSEFYFAQNYYVGKIQNLSMEKDGTSKLVVFDWGGGVENPRLLVYDESDDIDNLRSDHRRLFEVWPPIAPGVKMPPDSRRSIYAIKSRKMGRHFYVVYINYGAPNPGFIKIN